MAYAPTSTYFDIGDGSILGRFIEKDYGHTFEFSQGTDDVFPGYPHKLWICGTKEYYRHALIKKTVAYVVTDEGDGKGIVKKWSIKNHTLYHPHA